MADDPTLSNQKTSWEADTYDDIQTRAIEKTTGKHTQVVVPDFGGSGAEDFDLASLLASVTYPISGSITVDSEFPAAAAITDNFANPTTTSVMGMTMVWDGAAWDRQTQMLTEATFAAEDFATSANQTTIIGHVDGIEALLTTIDADTSTLAAVDYATAANQTTIIGHVDGIEALLTTIDTDTGVLAGAVIGGFYQVQVDDISAGTQTNDVKVTLDGEAISFPQGMVDTFAHLMTVQPNNQVDVQFYRDTPANLVAVTTSAGGSASASGGTATFSTSTNSNGQAKGVTNTTTIYHSGAEMYALFTAAWPTGGGSAGSLQRIGLYDDDNGFFIGYEGTTFGVTTRKGTSDTQVAKASFSEDDLTGGGSSLFTRNGTPEAIDLTTINVFRVRFGWLGSAPIKFEVLAPDGNWVLFHQILQPNLVAVASIEDADLPVTCHVDNNGANSTDLQILTNCWGAGTTLAQGKISDNLSTEALATLNRSVITGETSAGGGALVNVKVSPSGALSVEAEAAFAEISTVSDDKPGSLVGVTTSSTPVVSANADRFNVVIENTTGTDIYICLSATATTGTAFMILYNKGDVLNIPGWYHDGAISAIHVGSGTKNILVTEVENIP